MFESFTPDTAPAAARPMLLASQKQFGFVPDPVAKAAASPIALKHLLAGFAAFEASSLSHLEREVVAMTVAYHNGCHYCMALHSAQLEPGPLVEALRAGTALPEPRLEALRLFVRQVIAGESSMPAFAEAGFTHQNAVDAVLGIGVYMLSTLLNVVTAAKLDAPFATFAWSR